MGLREVSGEHDEHSDSCSVSVLLCPLLRNYSLKYHPVKLCGK